MQERKIFLADDDAEDRSIIQDAMESINAGDIIMFADSGEQLLNLLQKKLFGYFLSLFDCAGFKHAKNEWLSNIECVKKRRKF